MADTSNLNQFLTDVANSIRNKKGTEEPIPAENFDTEIDSIVTGTIVEKVVAEANQIVEDETVVKIDSAPIGEQVVILPNSVTEVVTDKSLLASSIGVTCDKIVEGNNILGIEGTGKTIGNYQEKSIEITTNGLLEIFADENYDALSKVSINVNVEEQTEDQHMPFYLLESDDEGNLYCINNYEELKYIPYSLDESGNLIIMQDDNDTAQYSINENMELEVVING